MTETKPRKCKTCGTAENLHESKNICRACLTAKEKHWYQLRKHRNNERRGAKLAADPFHVPAITGPCGHDFDSEVCPKRQILAVKRAKAKKKIDNICCLDCTVKIQEAQQ